jgi:hypothetical protein
LPFLSAPVLAGAFRFHGSLSTVVRSSIAFLKYASRTWGLPFIRVTGNSPRFAHREIVLTERPARAAHSA